ncbi:MAG TPA: hypothetical protein PLV13_04140 [Ilumatobacteraceae bacterium]|nr:hypothetical protein [Ilumatobacteraceae bacterium]
MSVLERMAWALLIIGAPMAAGAIGAACGLMGSIRGALVVTRPGGRGLSGNPAADIGLVVGALCVFDGSVAVGIVVWSLGLEQLLEARFLRRPLRGFEMLLLFSSRGVHLASASGRAVTFSHQATLYGEPSNQLWRNPLWCTVLITDGDAVWRIAVRRRHLPAVVAAWDATAESVAAG